MYCILLELFRSIQFSLMFALPRCKNTNRNYLTMHVMEVADWKKKKLQNECTLWFVKDSNEI